MVAEELLLVDRNQEEVEASQQHLEVLQEVVEEVALQGLVVAVALLLQEVEVVEAHSTLEVEEVLVLQALLAPEPPPVGQWPELVLLPVAPSTRSDQRC